MENPPKKQFDSTLGGDKVLPHTLNVMQFISSRSHEIAALSEAIENPQRTTLVNQRLPKHMQRRIMSHNAKRLPTALRQAFIEAREKSGNPTEIKRPRRKYRRRPQNLLNEYNRRQQKFIWLETHIWHAKRFHMINKWGYKLPQHPNDKSYRACYRASTQHCLIQDVSYYVCIEINGDLDHIVDGVNRLTSPLCGLTFGAKYFLNGSREGSTIVYHSGQYPYGVIGPVKFLWKSLSKGGNKNGEISSTNMRTLWIWVHPAYYTEFFDEIIKIFSLVRDKNNDSIMEVDDRDGDDNETNNNKKNDITNCRNRVIKYFSNSYCDIVITELKDSINRLRLTGPLSQSIITDAFLLLNFDDVKKSLPTSEIAINNSNDDDWIKRYYFDDDVKINALKIKHELWSKFKNVTDPSQLPMGMVLPLVIRDPRFNLPNKRTKVVSDTKEIDEQVIVDPPGIDLLNDSPFWDALIRDKVTSNKLSTSDMNHLQSKLLVPGTISDIAKEYNVKHYLPVIVIHNHSYITAATDRKSQGVGTGWDIILPSGWAMPVWLSLVWRGARAGGLREDVLLRHESNIMPLTMPDSNFGQIEDESDRQNLSETYFKKPPAKRPNYTKLGIAAPFYYPWKELLKEWNNVDGVPLSFYVLRDKSKLKKIKLLIDNFSRKSIDSDSHYDPSNYLEMSKSDVANCIVGMSVKMCGRGRVSEHSVVCIPLKEDLVKLCSKIAKDHPMELPHSDSKEAERSAVRKEHLKFLQRMKRKRKKFKSNGDFDNYELYKNITLEHIKSNDDKIKELWLPNVSDIGVKDSCSRKIMGYCVTGDYSFSQSSVFSQAYIALTALFDLLNNNYNMSISLNGISINKPIVLVRTSTSLKYSFATVDLANSSFL